MLFWPILLIASVVLAVFLVGMPDASVLTSVNGEARLAYITVLALALITGAVLRLLMRGGWRTLIHSAVWLGLFAGIAGLWTLRADIEQAAERVRGELVPSMALNRAGGEVELRRAWDGHYRADTRINGTKMRMIVDTGASMVLIPYEKVPALGIDTADLEFSIPVSTANGNASVAPIHLSSVKVGAIAMTNVEAAVAQPGRLKNGLLGMSFLDRLSETTFQGDRLILRQRPRDVARYFKRAPGAD